MAQERDGIMTYVQLWGFSGLAAREVNKMNDLNFKKNSKQFKRSHGKGGIMTYVVFMAFDGQTGSRELKRSPGEVWNHDLRSATGLLRPSGLNSAAPVSPENLRHHLLC